MFNFKRSNSHVSQRKRGQAGKSTKPNGRAAISLLYGPLLKHADDRTFELAQLHYPHLIERMPKAMETADCPDLTRSEQARYLSIVLAGAWLQQRGIIQGLVCADGKLHPRVERNCRLLWRLLNSTALHRMKS